MPRSAMQQEFAALVIAASTSRLDTFACKLSDWVVTYQWCSGNLHNGHLSQSRNRRLLDTITLDSIVDTTGKIELLVRTYGADVNWIAPSSEVDGLLAKTIFANRPESAHALLSHGADPNARRFIWGRNTFVCATLYNQIDVVKKMRLHGAYLWQSSEYGDTAMVCAVKHFHVELINFFLQEGVSPNWSDSESHQTLLHHACYTLSLASTSVIRLLLSAGANPYTRCIQTVSVAGPPQWAVETETQDFNSSSVDVETDNTTVWLTPLQYLTHFRDTLTARVRLSEVEEELLSLNASTLETHMKKNCQEWALAVCMSTHDRLGSGECSLHQLAVEPGLLQMIMNQVTSEFDPEFPDTPILPNI